MNESTTTTPTTPATTELRYGVQRAARLRVEAEIESGVFSSPAEVLREGREIAGCWGAEGRLAVRRAAIAYMAAYYATLDGQLSAVEE